MSLHTHTPAVLALVLVVGLGAVLFTAVGRDWPAAAGSASLQGPLAVTAYP